ncbi:MAG: RluA family pseudouridine synthase [Alphaproteobacteria bacterium]|nr:RluA family pseudouridine synthase [Alphaproteobacteria bacterium]
MTMPNDPSTEAATRHHVIADTDGDRLDRMLATALSGHSRTRIKALIENGQLTSADATITDPSYRVKSGEAFTLDIPPAEPAIPQPEAIDLNVIYEDLDLVVIDKPAGLVVHPAPGNSGGTLVNALLAHCGETLSGIGGVKRPGIVHRLDKETSGLIVVAKNDNTHIDLSEQFSARTISRAYQALVWGIPRPRSGDIEGNIGRNRQNRKKMAVLPSGGKNAKTGYKVIKRFGNCASLIECKLATGRTHQIRVHMAHIGHPVIGDTTYGGGISRARRTPLNEETLKYIKQLRGQTLHAFELGFRHPGSAETVKFMSQLPIEMRELIALLESL